MALPAVSGGRWDRLGHLLDEALALDAEERRRFLDRASAEDPALGAELVSLVEAHERAGPLDTPAAEWMAPLFAAGEADDAEDPDHPGEEVGPYRVGERVGGALGSVYRARDERLERDVALKVLPLHLSADPVARGRFLREARSAASLEHPNICTILEAGQTDDGRLYLVMPFYRGETLQEMLARGPLPIPTALDVALQVARGLAAAHGHGIVHRDVKPGNIMVTEDGVARLLDFGIAKLAGVTLTRTGARIGTAAYMSPEQVRGEHVDARSDIWALGATLYEMLAGERPFRGETALEVFSAILHSRPSPIAELRPDLPARVAGLLDRMLAEEPAGRPSSIDEVVASLQGLEPPRAPPRSRRRRALGLVAAALVLVAGGALVARNRPAPASAGSAEGPEPRAIAVLPFESVAGPGASPTLADGMHADVVTALSGMGALRVIARGSVLPYRDRPAPLREVGAELGVDVVVEGSIQQLDDHLRINIHMADVHTGRLLWAERYDREITAADLFAVQTEIASRIVEALERSLTPEEQRRLSRAPTASLTAYEFANQSRLAFDGTVFGNLEQERLLREALAVDTAYAAAWGALAAAFSWRPLWTGLPTFWWDSALVAADRAQALDPNQFAPYLARSIVAKFQGHLERAEREARAAIERNPSHDQGYRQLGESFRERGRFDEALEQHRMALRLAPNSPLHRAWIGHLHLDLGRVEEAERYYREVVRLRPNHYAALEGLAVAAFLRGDTARALEVAAEEVATNPGDPAVLAAAAMVAHYAGDAERVRLYGAAAASIAGDAPLTSWDMLLTTILGHEAARAGDRPRADSLFAATRRFLDERRADGANSARWLYERALLEAAAGRRETALRELEAAYRAGFRWAWMLERNPMLDGVRADPRFARLLERIRTDVAAMRDRAAPA